MALSEKEKKDRAKLNIEIGKLIREKRLAKKLTVDELSDECNLERSNISRIEGGRVNTSIYILNKIAKALDLSLEEFFNGF